MLRRKVTNKLLTWKNLSNKALLVTGARQIGKSYAIREFGKANYSCFVEINLLLDKSAKQALAQALNATDFINCIALFSKKTLVENNTLVFVDEIQEYPEIVTLMKALVEDGRYSYVFSGSMLGTEFKGISSFPVGYVDQIVMRPMDFEEFCWAVGVSEQFLDQIRTRFIERKPVEEYLHNDMMRNFRAYLIVGGMPEVVQTYIDSKYSLAKIRKLQTLLVNQYSKDISKYAGNRAFEVRAIFDQIPLQLEGETHRFNLSALEDSARMSKFHHDFLWLVNAGVALQVLRTSEARMPLKRTEQTSMFKLYESDTGMLVSRYPQSAARALYLDMKDPNFGGIYENAIAQELTAAAIPLWYYQSDTVGEVDFLIEGKSGNVVPIEVKSGKKVHSHAALDRLVSIGEYKIKEALVLSRNNVSQEGRITYVPLYMSFCLVELTEAGEASEGEGDFTLAPAVPKPVH